MKKTPFIIQLQTAPPDGGDSRKIMIITCGVSNKQLVRKSTAHTSNVQTSHQVADLCLYYQYTPRPFIRESKAKFYFSPYTSGLSHFSSNGFDFLCIDPKVFEKISFAGPPLKKRISAKIITPMRAWKGSIRENGGVC